MAKAFTASDVDRALTAKNRPAEGRREIAIGGGLELVVFAEGPGRWRFRYRPRGINPATGQRHTQRKVPVGDTDTHSLREAQAKAAELKLRVTQGHDPAQADRAAAREARAAAAAAERQAKLDAAARVTCKDKLDGTVNSWPHAGAVKSISARNWRRFALRWTARSCWTRPRAKSRRGISRRSWARAPSAHAPCASAHWTGSCAGPSGDRAASPPPRPLTGTSGTRHRQPGNASLRRPRLRRSGQRRGN